jgi:hypothetical protein
MPSYVPLSACCSTFGQPPNPVARHPQDMKKGTLPGPNRPACPVSIE